MRLTRTTVVVDVVMMTVENLYIVQNVSLLDPMMKLFVLNFDTV